LSSPFTPSNISEHLHFRPSPFKRDIPSYMHYLPSTNLCTSHYQGLGPCKVGECVSLESGVFQPCDNTCTCQSDMFPSHIATSPLPASTASQLTSIPLSFPYSDTSCLKSRYHQRLDCQHNELHATSRMANWVQAPLCSIAPEILYHV